TLMQAEYEHHSRYSASLQYTRFGSWNAALKAAGLQFSRGSDATAADVIADIQRVAKRLRTDQLTQTRYLANGGRHPIQVIFRRCGGWMQAVVAAKLRPRLYYRPTLQDLFANLERVWRTIGHQPSTTELAQSESHIGYFAYKRRFGSMQR